MSKLLILSPAPIARVTADRGSGVVNLLSADPKEVWADGLAGESAQIDIDLGRVQDIDTVFLGSLYRAADGATWSITGGSADAEEAILLPTASLRVPEATGQASEIGHAFWTGAATAVRYLRLTITQPAGAPRLLIGVVLVGRAFVSQFGHEWGAGRKVIDTGTATPLPSGGYAMVEGARKGSYSWTFGDLSPAEVDALYAIQLDRGETRPLLVAEDPAMAAGLRWRLHYGKLASLRQYERRNPAQTRWEMTIEEWI